MSPELWPLTRADGGVIVAARFHVPDSASATRIQQGVASWIQYAASELKKDLNASLERPPFVAQTQAGHVDVVFEGRPGSKLWRDWLVSFTGYMARSHPDLQPDEYCDLVGGRCNSVTRQ